MNFRNILDSYERELEIARCTEDLEKQALLFNYISAIYRLMGNWQQSYQCQQKGLNLARNCSQLATCVALSNLGALCVEMSEFNNAEKFLYESLSIAKELKNPLRIASAEGNLGKAFLYRGIWNKALIHYKNALREGQNVNSSRHQMCSLTSLGKLKFDQGNFDEANQYFEKAMIFSNDLKQNLETDINCNPNQIVFLENGSNLFEEKTKQYRDIFVLELAKIKLLRHQKKLLPTEFENIIASILKSVKLLNYRYGEIEIYLEKSKFYRSIKNWQVALTESNIAYDLSKKLGAKQLEAFATLELGIIYSNMSKNFSKGNEHFSCCKKTFNNIGDNYNYHKSMLYESLYSMKQKSNKEFGTIILNSLQNISSIKFYESIDVISDIFQLFHELQKQLDQNINVILSNTDVKFLNMNNEKNCSEKLSESLQSHLTLINQKSIVQIISRAAKKLRELCPNNTYNYQKEKILNLENSLKLLSESLESVDDIVQSVSTIYKNEISRFKQKHEYDQNIMFQVMQSSLSSLSATSIYITLLLHNSSQVSRMHLLNILIILIITALIPIFINNLLTAKKRKIYKPIIGLLSCIILMILSIIYLIGVIL